MERCPKSIKFGGAAGSPRSGELEAQAVNMDGILWQRVGSGAVTVLRASVRSSICIHFRAAYEADRFLASVVWGSGQRMDVHSMKKVMFSGQICPWLCHEVDGESSLK